MKSMFMKVQRLKSVIFVVIVGILILINKTDVYADVSVGMDYLIKHNVTAKIYDTDEYSAGGQGIALSNTGAIVESWDYKKSKYLQIDIFVDSTPNEVHIVELKLAPIFYIASNINEIPAGYSKVERMQYGKIPCNNNQYEYTLKNGSGIFRYYLKPNMTRASIQVELRYDPELWDKFGGTVLTEENVSPIEVSMFHEQSIIDNTLEVNASKIKVSKATSGNGIAGTGSLTYRRIWNNARWNPATNFYQYKDKIARILLITTEPGREYIYKYYKKMTVEIDVPYCEYKGKKVYVGYKKDTFNFDGVYRSSGTKVNIEKATDSKIIFSINGYYAPDDNFNMVDFIWPEGFKVDKSTKEVIFDGGHAKVSVTTNGGTQRYLLDSKMGYIQYSLEKKENVTVGYNTFTNVLREKYPQGAVTKLGTGLIGNYGTDDSTSKIIKYQFNEKHLITAILLPSDVQSKEYKVRYTLRDEDGKRVYLNAKGERVSANSKNKIELWEVKISNSTYNSADFDNTRTLFSRNHIAQTQRDYYFETIEYTIATVRTRTFLFDSGDTSYSSSGAGTFYGRLSKNAKAGDIIENKIIITSPANSGINTLTSTVKSKVVDTERASYGINNTKFSQDHIKAGKTLTLSGSVFAYYTFYSADCTWLHNIRMGIALPKGVSINKDKIVITTSKSKKKIKVEKVQKKENNENNIWLIDLDKSEYIGYYSDGLGELSQGAALNFSIELETDIYMNTTTLYTDKMMYVAGIGQENYIDVCAKGYKTTDIYDINGNGSISDYIGCVKVNEAKSCTINGEPPKLYIEDDVKVLDKEGRIREEDSIAFPSDVVQYDISIKSINDGTASSFDYYIPIPDRSLLQDEYFSTEKSDKSFDLYLTEKASLKGDNIYTIQYTTLRGMTYKEARAQKSEWYTAEELTAAGKSIADVTMVKLIVKSGDITKGMDTTITLKMKYVGLNIVNDKDRFIKWNSCGYYDFDDNVKFVSGHFPTNGVRVKVEPDESLLARVVFVDETDSMYYVYDILNDTKTTRSEPVEFYIDRPIGSSDTILTISESDNIEEIKKYFSSENILLTDENGKVVMSVANKYKLKPQVKYILTFKNLSFATGSKKESEVYLYAEVKDRMICEHIALRRATAFQLH